MRRDEIFKESHKDQYFIQNCNDQKAYEKVLENGGRKYVLHKNFPVCDDASIIADNGKSPIEYLSILLSIVIEWWYDTSWNDICICSL